jgi:hypothetical protein
MTYLGNRLDLLVRQAQDKQTIGIPIGPDISLLIAEILMQACDRELIQEVPNVRGYRYIDDYELGFSTRTEADNAYHVLQSILSKYELSLNPRKTEIIDLPFLIDSGWTHQLKCWEFRDTVGAQRTDLLDYFNCVFKLASEFPGNSILSYATSRVFELDVHSSNWHLFCELLLNCAVPDPACLPYVLKKIISGFNAGLSCPNDVLENALNNILFENSRINHTSEVAWALWACLALELPIHENVAREVENCDNSVVALLALHADSVNLVRSGLNVDLWSTYMTGDDLYDEHWLLAYEANVKGWLPSVGGGDHVMADRNFSFLKSANVSFYDVTAAVPESDAQAPLPDITIFHFYDEF